MTGSGLWAHAPSLDKTASDDAPFSQTAYIAFRAAAMNGQACLERVRSPLPSQGSTVVSGRDLQWKARQKHKANGQ